MSSTNPSSHQGEQPASGRSSGAPPLAAIVIAVVLGLAAVGAAVYMLMSGGGKPIGAPIAVRSPSAVTAASQPMTVDFTPARTMNFRAVEKQSQTPVAGIQIKIRYQGRSGPEVYERTDADGRVKIPLPAEDPKEFSISVKPSGYVPLKCYWGGNYNKLPIPGEFTLEMEKGSTVGGVVKDEEGQPIEGAQVNIYTSSDRNSPVRVEYASSERVRTDKDGKWTFNKASSDPKNIYVSVTHPNYIPAQRGSVALAPDQLRAQTAPLTMKKGIELTGTILDADGQPVAGANVLVGTEQYSSDALKAKTDAAGTFRIANALEGSTVVTVSGRNHAPELKQVTVTKQMQPLEFKLEKGRRLRGKVVDSSGNGIPDVQVSVGQWRNRNTLEFSQRTRDDGTFEWTGAPADAVNFYFSKQNYRSAGYIALMPGDKEHVITLKNALTVTGTVVDAETSEPIPSFNVIKGRAYDERNLPYFERYNMKTGTKGQYSLEYTDDVRMVVVRIEAEGYQPQVSPRTRPTADSLVIHFKLKKGSGPTGIVITPDGKPAAGAQLGVASAGQNLNVGDGDLTRYSDNRVVRAGADGRFKLNPEAEPYRVLIVHESGYAEFTQEQLTASTEIKLKPWGRVEGQFLIGSKPATGARINMYHTKTSGAGRPQIYHNNSVTADSEGRFKFERVMSGKVSIGRMVERGDGNNQYWTTTHAEAFEIKPGETLSVTIGGKGREVIGRLEIPTDLPEGRWRFDSHNSNATTFARPAATSELKTALRGLLGRRSPRATANVEYRNYPVEIGPDGKFKIEDVMPGTYRLHTSIHEVIGDNRSSNMLASVSHEFTVPESAPAGDRSAVDLGTIKMIRHAYLRPGDAAPAFTVKTMDGKDVKLEDFKGKHLLLVFWSVGDDDPQQLDLLNTVHKEFGSDGRLALLGLAYFGNEEQLKDRVKTLELAWPQAMVRQVGSDSLMTRFTSQRFPSIFLIGPDGKIVARDPSGPGIRAAVAKALGKE